MTNKIKEMQKIIEREQTYYVVAVILFGLVAGIGIIFGSMSNTVWMFAGGLFSAIYSYLCWKKAKKFERYIE